MGIKLPPAKNLLSQNKMTGKGILVYLLVLLALKLSCQQVIKSNKQYNFDDTTGGFLSINCFKANNDYLLAGIVSTSIISKGLGLIRTDSVGVIKYQKMVPAPGFYTYSNNTANQPFCQLKNGNILYTGQMDIGLDYYKSALVRFNHFSADTIWSKTYSQPGDTTFLLCSIELSDSSIMAFGNRFYEKNNNLYSKPFLLKVDKNGNYLGHKFINTFWDNYFCLYQKVIKRTDNDFVTTYIRKNSGGQTNYIMRFDSTGIKSYDIPISGLGSNKGILNDCIELPDGSVLGGGLVFLNTTSPNNTRKLLYKFNANTGALISTKSYNIPAEENGILTLIYKGNNEILTGGGTGVPYTTPAPAVSYGDILKVNANLDSLSTYAFGSTTNSLDKYAPNQFVLTNDGGFAAAMVFYPNSTQQKFWMIKADSNCCYNSACPINSLKENYFSDKEISIFPNPAFDYFELKTSLNYSQSNFDIQITSLDGRMLLNQRLNDNQKKINISFLNGGIYIVKVLSNDKVFVSKKLIKH